MKALLARYKASRLGRTLAQYGARSGAVLAGGVAYAALFSVFGVLVAAFSIFGLLLGADQELFDQVVDAIAAAMPGLLQTSTSSGAIDPQSLVQPNLFSTTGAIAFLAALFAGLGWVDALRNAIRTMNDLPVDGQNVVVTKLLDVVWLASLGITLLASAVLSIGLTSIGGLVLDLFGLTGGTSRGLVRGGGFLLVGLVVAVLLWIVFRWLAGLRLPLKRLRGPLLIGGLALALLTQFSGLFVGSAGTKNPVLATGALLVTLLVLFNLISRLVLYLAAWIATFPDPDKKVEMVPVELIALTKPDAGDPPVGVLGPAELEPAPGAARMRDRGTLAAGLVLGAGLAVFVRELRETTRVLFGRQG